MNVIINGLNQIIAQIGGLITSLFNLLPATPFDSIYQYLNNDFFMYLNWIVPIPEILVFLVSWTTAVSLYYIVSLVLRWIKAIE